MVIKYYGNCSIKGVATGSPEPVQSTPSNTVDVQNEVEKETDLDCPTTLFFDNLDPTISDGAILITLVGYSNDFSAVLKDGDGNVIDTATWNGSGFEPSENDMAQLDGIYDTGIDWGFGRIPANHESLTVELDANCGKVTYMGLYQ